MRHKQFQKTPNPQKFNKGQTFFKKFAKISP